MPKQSGYDMGRVKHIHFIGIGGAGMSGVAEVFHNLGYDISGSDLHENQATKHLQKLGINVVTGHASDHINGSDVVVVSSAITEDNPEWSEARARKIPVVPRAEMLAELMRFRQGIAVAGTHGKTTTTSLIASVLAEGGLDPTYVIGGLLNSSGSHAKLGSSKYLVAEADESDASFLHLQPIIAVLTNIDADHLDTYGGDFAVLRNNFVEFLQRLPFYGLAVICVDDPGIQQIRNDILKPVLTYGIDYDSDFSARIIKQEKNKSWFTVSREGNKDWLDIELNLPGKHNVQNALAAIAIANELHISEESIVQALKNFQGIARRCQLIGEIEIDKKRILLIDDYAHHPHEIRATLAAINSGWPGRRLILIYQPHRYTRTRDLFEDFTSVLSEVDVLFLMDVYPAGEEKITGADSKSICRAIRIRGQVDPIFVEDRNQILSYLKGVIREDDILLILGAGDIGTLATELTEQLNEKVH